MCFNDIGALRFPSAPTDADVCVDRCGCLRRPVRNEKVRGSHSKSSGVRPQKAIKKGAIPSLERAYVHIGLPKTVFKTAYKLIIA